MDRPSLPLSINQATVRPQWTLRQAIEGCARLGVEAISVWPDKLAECGLSEARKMLDDHGMGVATYCVGGKFASAELHGTKVELDRLRRLVDEAAAIGADCMICVVGTVAPGSIDLRGARERVLDGMSRLLPHARSAGLPLAIEPIHPMRAADLCCINTLAQALDMCDQLGAGTGVAVDVYHVWWDPDLEDQIARAAGRILSFQVCDWLHETRSTSNERGMMGDGVIDIRQIRRWIEATGYRGYCDVEIMSANDWWHKDPDEVVRTCIGRYETIC
jgi:sugar phosphate isomerase/epimerase